MLRLLILLGLVQVLVQTLLELHVEEAERDSRLWPRSASVGVSNGFFDDDDDDGAKTEEDGMSPDNDGGGCGDKEDLSLTLCEVESGRWCA